MPKPKKAKAKKSKQGIQFPKLWTTKHLWFYLAFLALSFLLYGQTLGYGFILDDKLVLSENNFVKQGFQGLWDIFSNDSFVGYFGEKKDLLVGGRYRPLTLAIFAILYEFFGLNSSIFHLVNILEYGTLGFILFYLLNVLFTQSSKQLLSIPLVAVLLYLCHPLHVEAVANIKGLDEIICFSLAGISLLLALYQYKTNKWIIAILSFLSFFLALLAKENALTFLAVVPISIYIFDHWKSKLVLQIMSPLVLASVVYLFIRTAVLGYFIDPGVDIQDPLNNPFVGFTSSEYYGTVLFTWLEYFKLLWFPFPLIHDYYPYAIPIKEVASISSLLSLLLHIGLLILGIYGLIRKRKWSFAILFYFATFSIVSNAFFTVGTFMNDRFMFIPSFAFSLLLAIFWYQLEQKKGWLQWLGRALIAVVLLGYTFIIFDRVPDWKNALALNRSAVEANDRSARSNLFMGTALFNKAVEETQMEDKRALLDEAEAYIDRSIAIFPKYGNQKTKNHKYFNAYKMKVGVASEFYKLDGDINALLNTFKEVAAERPDIGYIKVFLEYVHKNGHPDAVFENFYNELCIKKLLQEKRDANWTAYYLDIGIANMPNNPKLAFYKSQFLDAIGRESEARQWLQKAQNLQR